ncbi:WbqC family protein [Pseudomonas massiliensis]|uniref:WbqC family protein n=1 Tax=Pseudomonas massiliensis TaxID=522492 RepID=UPI00058B09BE|nr:WbqC family protein [Pseudomonas massiliensis]
MKAVAILQSNYIPWKGYFDLIARVDEFVLYDDMQYTRRDWRNRNQIKTPQGAQWLTVPVRVKGRYFQTINETEIEGAQWAEAHWKALCQNYRRSPYFNDIAQWLEPIYREQQHSHLAALNRRLIEAVCSYLQIGTRITLSSDYTLIEGKTERLADLCRQAGGDIYVSGPAARSYIDASVFTSQGIELQWFDYAGYPEYPQLWDGFIHAVTILDLLFNCGPEAPGYMRYVR